MNKPRDANDILREKGADGLREAFDKGHATPSLADVHKLARTWFGEDYDLAILDAVLATAAAERLKGDPLWLLVIGGPGNTKTETVSALAGCGAQITSTIASEGALLSATPRKSRVKTATGGLLRRIGDRGLLVIKDVTTILSADHNVRASVLAALREVYDGLWERNVGSDGGQTLTWNGRIAVVGAVTTAWDTHHAVVSALGDRFVLIRSSSTTGRRTAGAQALRNVGREAEMRAELAHAAGKIISGINPRRSFNLTEDEESSILDVADIVTLARTSIEADYQGNPIDAHAPEMPTRFAKQLKQLMRGTLAIGMDRKEALRLAIRCARDSIPPIRMVILADVSEHPHSKVAEIRKRLQRPRMTVDRTLQGLQLLELLICDEIEDRKGKTTRYYTLAKGGSLDPLS